MRIELFGIRVEIARVKALLAKRIWQRDRAPKQVGERYASDNFWRAFSYGSTIVAQCRCGRTHFPLNTTMDYEEGELEKLIADSVTHPDRFLADPDNDAIGVFESPNGLICWRCPCHADKSFEEFLINYRREILEYYRYVQEALTSKEQREREQLNKVLTYLREEQKAQERAALADGGGKK